MKQFGTSFLCIVFSLPVIGQSSLNDLNVFVKQDFENNTLGDYNLKEWAKDWPDSYHLERMEEMDIVQDNTNPENPSKALQFNFPEGTMSPWNGGGSWYYKIPKQDELYVSYDLMFMPGFKFQNGGKLPSVMGGELPVSGRPTGYEGFTGGLMFKGAGNTTFYLYYADQMLEEGGTSVNWGQNNYPSDYFLPSSIHLEYANGDISYFAPGKWHNLTYRIVLNTMKSEGGGNYDGILEAYFDGILVTQVTHLLFRNTADIAIDCFRMYSFFGGDEESWKTPIDEWLRIDNVMLYTFKDDIDVPRGNKLSPTNRTINYWRKLALINTVAPDSPSSLISTAQTKYSASISWNDNSSNEYGFKIYRSTSPDDNFTEIYSTTANITSFTNSDLQPGTSYYYQVRAYNDIGYSDYTSVLEVATQNLNLPNAPSSLIGSLTSNSSATFSWTDNSNNETGFEIEFTNPDNTVQKLKINSNITSYSISALTLSSNYTYRVRAYNDDGYSAYSNPLLISTPYIVPPATPSSLKTMDYSDKSISIKWDDNSGNETGFLITRVLNSDTVNKVEITVPANDTIHTDSDLLPSTTYHYTIKAVNDAGNSNNSNENIAATVSVAESKRIKDGLIAYYNFTYNSDKIIYDLSGYGDPVNLKILQPAAVIWDDANRLKVLGNTTLASTTSANKIRSAVNETGEITVECWIKPSEPDFASISRVISFGINDDDVGFVLDQIYDNNGKTKTFKYGVRLQTESTNTSGYPEIISNGGVDNINLLHLAYVRDSLCNEILYLNGDKIAKAYRPGNFGNWNSNSYLKLGNENDQNFAWQGTFYSVAIFKKALSQYQVRRNYSVGPCDSIRYDGLDYLLNVYPNPIIDKATIEVTPSESQDIIPQSSVEILDIYGKAYFHDVIFNPSNKYTRILDFTSFAKGTYFLRVISGNKQKSTKLVIQ